MTSHRTFARPDLGNLELTEISEGVEVGQGQHAYIAKGWRLTDEVLSVVETALSAGLNAMIQKGHPQPRHRLPTGQGVVYLTFSGDYDDQWVFVLNDRSGPKTAPTQVTFNKRFSDALDAAGVVLRSEGRGGNHPEVTIANLPRAIEAIAPYR